MRTFTLRPVAPFRLDLTVWALRRLAVNRMDRWDAGTYRRVLAVGSVPVEAAVVQRGPTEGPELRVILSRHISESERSAVTTALEKLLGLNVDLVPFHRMAQRDAKLRPLAERLLGLKPPRMPSVFEAAINGISCQQLSLSVGIHLLNRITERYCPPVGVEHAFPRPQDLTAATPAEFRAMGYSMRKAECIMTLARRIAASQEDLESLTELDDDAALEHLRALPGIGRWTAEYILLRGLGRLDSFPGDDIGGQTRVQRWFDLVDRPGYDRVQETLAPWRPYRGLLYFCLLVAARMEEGAV